MGKGITKFRYFEFGWQAATNHFIVADMNKDSLTDIGVITESIDNSEKIPYQQQPIKWYIFQQDHWKYAPTFDGNLSVDFTDLPLIKSIMSPIDYVVKGNRFSLNPKKWRNKQRIPLDTVFYNKKNPYMPLYRKRLIEGE